MQTSRELVALVLAVEYFFVDRINWFRIDRFVSCIGSIYSDRSVWLFRFVDRINQNDQSVCFASSLMGSI